MLESTDRFSSNSQVLICGWNGGSKALPSSAGIFVRVKGPACYLHRAIPVILNSLDLYFSPAHDQKANSLCQQPAVVANVVDRL